MASPYYTTMTATTPQPISTRTERFDNLPPHYLEAANNASELLVPEDIAVRIETYRTEDIRQLVENTWGWVVTLEQLDADAENQADARRVRTIIDLIRAGKPQWPYISHWADDINELAEVQTYDDGTTEFHNHGDGWHRIIAAVALQLPTIEILYL